ncbi:MAG TPA: flap endonuclease [Leucothrix mucor]|uniref:Flap endonuclease n=1 Tax=Leucothrix mucor TaxID=45248 RepID=A0A7V2WVH1_LEUMU|nr:flap endonuclease [Leucothrix mucor]
MKNNTAWLVDSNIYVYEAWQYCKSQQVDYQGREIKGVIGFLYFVYQLLSKERPAVIAFAFDEKLKNSHRKALYPEYKAHRKPLSPELALQFKYCRAFLDSLGLYQSSSHHYEADDLIGTWVRDLRRQDYKLNIITADKDLLQLIEEGDHWWSYQKNYKHTVKSFHKRFRIYPYQVADQLALAGDKSDNIPGVSGIGMSTAAKLLRKFGSIEEIFKQQDTIHKMQIRYAKQVQDAIAEHHESIRLAQQLSLIKCDIVEAHTADILQQRSIDQSAFSKIAQQLGLTIEQQQEWLALIGKL